MSDERVAELYGLPAEEFTAARDALAKVLRAEGDKAAAAEVKALRRPSVAAWAVNQIARDRPDLVDAVVDAGAGLVAAQEELLAGRGRDALRAAMAARRGAVNTATTAAVARVGGAQRDAVHATFDAAASDEEAAAAVRAGRLAKELEPPSGFALLGDGGPTPTDAGPDPEPEPEPGPDPAEVAAAEAALAAARAEVDAATAARDDLARQLEAADERLDAAERAAAEAEERVRDLNDQ